MRKNSSSLVSNEIVKSRKIDFYLQQSCALTAS